MRYLTAAIAAAAVSLTSFTAIAQEAEEATEEMAMETPEYRTDVDASTVLATVNGVDITMGHVILLRLELPEQYLSAPDDILFEAILDQLIEQELLSASITEEPNEIKFAMDNELRALRAGAGIQQALGDEPTDAEFQAAYDDAFAEFEGQPEYNASHILVETEEEAQALVTELEGGADFAALAMEKSIGPSGPNGGELGWFGLGQMVAEFENAVTELEVGAISGPIQTQFGWHVIILNDQRTTEPPALEEVKGELAQMLQQDRITAAIEALRTDAAIEMFVDDVDPAAMKDFDLIGD